MAAYVYMVECADDSYYTGWTNDVKPALRRTMTAPEPVIPVGGGRFGWYIGRKRQIRKTRCGAKGTSKN